MTLAGKISPMIILKATKNQGFTLLLEDTFFREPHHNHYNYFLTRFFLFLQTCIYGSVFFP